MDVTRTIPGEVKAADSYLWAGNLAASLLGNEMCEEERRKWINRALRCYRQYCTFYRRNPDLPRPVRLKQVELEIRDLEQRITERNNNLYGRSRLAKIEQEMMREFGSHLPA